MKGKTKDIFFLAYILISFVFLAYKFPDILSGQFVIGLIYGFLLGFQFLLWRVENDG